MPFCVIDRWVQRSRKKKTRHGQLELSLPRTTETKQIVVIDLAR